LLQANLGEPDPSDDRFAAVIIIIIIVVVICSEDGKMIGNACQRCNTKRRDADARAYNDLSASHTDLLWCGSRIGRPFTSRSIPFDPRLEPGSLAAPPIAPGSAAVIMLIASASHH
jgi:hypothetical protein